MKTKPPKINKIIKFLKANIGKKYKGDIIPPEIKYLADDQTPTKEYIKRAEQITKDLPPIDWSGRDVYDKNSKTLRQLKSSNNKKLRCI